MVNREIEMQIMRNTEAFLTWTVNDVKGKYVAQDVEDGGLS
jgi:hypothetical protein